MDHILLPLDTVSVLRYNVLVLYQQLYQQFKMEGQVTIEELRDEFNRICDSILGTPGIKEDWEKYLRRAITEGREIKSEFGRQAKTDVLD